ncbi:MAG TPA: hypothetical protein V6D43_16385 [Candidatus Sericytochromatia bacterium]
MKYRLAEGKIGNIPLHLDPANLYQFLTLNSNGFATSGIYPTTDKGAKLSDTLCWMRSPLLT